VSVTLISIDAVQQVALEVATSDIAQFPTAAFRMAFPYVGCPVLADCRSTVVVGHRPGGIDPIQTTTNDRFRATEIYD
jgi:hypothetical protein